MRGYCGAKESVALAQAQFILGPRPKPRRAIAEDDLLLGTSLNAQRKEQTECRGRAREKAANTVRQNSASDKPVLKPIPMSMRFSSNPQPL